MHCKSPGDLRRQSSVPDMACQESVRRNVSALGPSDRFDPRIAPIRVRPNPGLAVDTRGLHQLPALTRIMLQGGTLQAVRSRLQLFSPGTKRRAFKSLAERSTARYQNARDWPIQPRSSPCNCLRAVQFGGTPLDLKMFDVAPVASILERRWRGDFTLVPFGPKIAKNERY